MRRLTFLALSAVLAACTGPAEEAMEAPPVVAASSGSMHRAVAMTPQQEAGRVVFESVCWTCHGLGGHGDGPAETSEVAPPTFHTRDYQAASPAILMQRFRASIQGDDPSHPLAAARPAAAVATRPDIWCAVSKVKGGKVYRIVIPLAPLPAAALASGRKSATCLAPS